MILFSNRNIRVYERQRMISVDIFELEKFLNDILEPWKFNDYCKNGIQIEGDPVVMKVVLGVAFNQSFVESSLEAGVQLLLVHHGIFGKDFFALKGYMKRRVERVLLSGLNLMGYHLPLDANNPYGNNATLISKLGLEIQETLSEIGYIGEYSSPIETDVIVEKLANIIPGQEFVVYKNRPEVKKVGIISGGGSDFFTKSEEKFDTYITGDIKEHIREAAKEMNVNFISAGHYATETFGVINLGGLLEKKFNLEIEFIDIPNRI